MHANFRWYNNLNGKAGLQGLDVSNAWQMRYQRIKIDEIKFIYRFKVFNTRLYPVRTWGLPKSRRSLVNAAPRVDADAENENEMEL